MNVPDYRAQIRSILGQIKLPELKQDAWIVISEILIFLGGMIMMQFPTGRLNAIGDLLKSTGEALADDQAIKNEEIWQLSLKLWRVVLAK